MNRDKQIEKLSKDIFDDCDASLFYSEAERIAYYVIEEKGYRKASDVAEKIFEEIENKITVSATHNARLPNSKRNTRKARRTMNRDKQIEEMAELERLLRIRRMDIEKQGCDIWALIKKTESEEQSIANYLIGHGYRKASDLEAEIEDLKAIAEQYQKQFEDARADIAREIFEVISKASVNWGCYCLTLSKAAFLTEDVNRTLAELKKKYTEEGK